MKPTIIDSCLNIVSTNNSELSQEELDEIRYGLEVLKANIPKLIIIGLIAAMLNLFVQYMMFAVFMTYLRGKAFGIHAEKSSTCLVVSTIMFIGAAYMIKFSNPHLIIEILISVLAIISMYLFAPADTAKRPLLNEEKRKLYKKQAIFRSSTLSILCLATFYYNSQISLACMWTLICVSIMVNPITYLITGQSYNNYEKIKEEENANYC